MMRTTIGLVHKFCRLFCVFGKFNALHVVIEKGQKSENFSIVRSQRHLTTLKVSDFYHFSIMRWKALNLSKTQKKVQNLCTNGIFHGLFIDVLPSSRYFTSLGHCFDCRNDFFNKSMFHIFSRHAKFRRLGEVYDELKHINGNFQENFAKKCVKYSGNVHLLLGKN